MPDDSYIIVTARGTVDLAVKVNAKIAEGYVPLGGLALDGGTMYAQAMIRQQK